ncbi:MAG TPA: chromosome partitioning protein ParB [Flavobacteriales bacterium]|nr:chromosome partitioning protein ParB [Flavobacteriales bacterium]|tara:strand:- start:2043 stop:2942 length:900 start_codon:yes stop_codon:yes gene_type:complete
MAEKKRALGKGLSALLKNPDTDITTNESIANTNQVVGSVSEIKIEQIEVNPFQPRTDFDQDALQELAISIKELGIIQPLTVRKLGYDKFQLISGERRFRASQLAGLKTVPVYVRIANDQAMLEMALVENIQREQLNPVEIALSYQRLIDECKLTQEKMSERVGKKRSTITNYLRLLKLPAEILAALRDESISMGHARALVNVKNQDTQINIFRDALNNGFTVREIEQVVKDFGDSSYTKTSRNRSKTLPSFEHQKLANDISNKIGKDVKLKVSKSGKGKIEIPFNSNDDLHQIISQLAL